ncbi:hypothetical protein NC653_006944 [Populus alba x Populus x berolinensis]|uniref:Uncharacterized protein n=2 Tax=Populus TaxID=3689 RepID=A0A4U5MN53_POPAL|nr:hypothetical protein NC653_006944 [Populus alba x Populus x berolinensis]TKR70970.1 hypothetical protein D5086_0000306260 [Populus alba]
MESKVTVSAARISRVYDRSPYKHIHNCKFHHQGKKFAVVRCISLRHKRSVYMFWKTLDKKRTNLLVTMLTWHALCPYCIISLPICAIPITLRGRAPKDKLMRYSPFVDVISDLTALGKTEAAAFGSKWWTRLMDRR